MPFGKILTLIAVIFFVLAALGSHPSILEDIELVPAGLAFGFGGFLTDKRVWTDGCAPERRPGSGRREIPFVGGVRGGSAALLEALQRPVAMLVCGHREVDEGNRGPTIKASTPARAKRA